MKKINLILSSADSFGSVLIIEMEGIVAPQYALLSSIQSLLLSSELISGGEYKTKYFNILNPGSVEKFDTDYKFTFVENFASPKQLSVAFTKLNGQPKTGDLSLSGVLFLIALSSTKNYNTGVTRVITNRRNETNGNWTSEYEIPMTLSEFRNLFN